MATVREHARNLFNGLLPPRHGAGPMLQRDYWAVIRNCRLRPAQVADLVARRFPEFAPEDLVRFRRIDGGTEPLETGDELEVWIRLTGTFRVRVVHRDRQSLTLATMLGHPEAGRITFGAYPNAYGDVIFHIRSRARSGSAPFYVGFLAVGEPMQTETWTEFVNRVALTTGEGVMGFIHAETTELRAATEENEALNSPTFLARDG